MGMGQENQGLCLLQKGFSVLVFEECVKHFEGSVALEIDMLAQVDLGKASAS